MINRRAFTGLMASSFAFASSAWAQSLPKKTVFFASVGPVLTLYDIDADAAALTARGFGDVASECTIRMAAPLAALFLCDIQQRATGWRRRAEGQTSTA